MKAFANNKKYLRSNSVVIFASEVAEGHTLPSEAGTRCHSKKITTELEKGNLRVWLL
jgi:hypothetical protein